MPRLNFIWLMIAVAFSLLCYQRADRNRYGRYFSEVLEHIDRQYVEPVDEQKLFEEAVKDMVQQLDEYSAFIPRGDAPRFRETLNQQFVGIGVEVALDEQKRLTVMAPLVGSPAYAAGVRAGDRIESIDGKSTKGFSMDDAVRLLRGKEGEQVVLSVLQEGRAQPVRVTITRANIKVDSVLGDRRRPDGTWDYLLPGPERIGYVRIAAFGERTYDELTAALAQLKAQKFRGLILDLRNNPGGLLEEAVRVCELFLDPGDLVVSTRGRDPRLERHFYATGEGAYRNVPVVVMVNRFSASASEIVAACLQDHKRAIVVGARSWGKGTVQNVIDTQGGRSMLRLTTATYWRPNGQNIHRLESSKENDAWGVKPDTGYEVKLTDEELARLFEWRRRRDSQASGASSQPAEDTDRAVALAKRYFVERQQPKSSTKR